MYFRYTRMYVSWFILRLVHEFIVLMNNCGKFLIHTHTHMKCFRNVFNNIYIIYIYMYNTYVCKYIYVASLPWSSRVTFSTAPTHVTLMLYVWTLNHHFTSYSSISHRFLRDPWVCAIEQSAVVVKPTYQTNDAIPCQ